MAVTKAEIAAAFNKFVRDRLTSPAAGQANWYYGNVPGAPVEIKYHKQLGPRSEPAMTADDIVPRDTVMSVSVFNVLHGFAMELTRVRKAQWFYFSDYQPIKSIPTITYSAALSVDLPVYFRIPDGQVEPGTVMTIQKLNDYLEKLRMNVQHIRTSSDYAHTIVACHSSCHGSCHGSRGRR